MHFILDNLAIGSFVEAQSKPQDINALLCVAQEKNLCEANCLYHKVPIIDMQPIPEQQLKEAVVFIQEHIHSHKIMVYCNAGIGRSPSVVVAYLCCFLNYGFGQAVEYVARRKPAMSTLPNLILSIDKAKELIGTQGGK